MGGVGVCQAEKDDLVSRLSKKRSVTIENLLNGLSLADLKTVCRNLGVYDSGRRKADIVARLAGKKKSVGSNGPSSDKYGSAQKDKPRMATKRVSGKTHSPCCRICPTTCRIT